MLMNIEQVEVFLDIQRWRGESFVDVDVVDF